AARDEADLLARRNASRTAELGEAIARRDTRIVELDAAVAARTNRISELSRAVTSRDHRIDELTAVISAQEALMRRLRWLGPLETPIVWMKRRLTRRTR
ncbi:MAG: hypothetical protein AAGG08_13620, partial [Actinomycetota bacterium]